MAAHHEPAPLEVTTVEGDGNQPPAAADSAVTGDGDDWWRRSASWWNQSDWQWSGWWGNRWEAAQWPRSSRSSYATFQTEGGQSGDWPSSTPGDASGDRRPQHQQPWRDGGSGTASTAATPGVDQAPTTTGEAAASSTADPWQPTWRSTATSWAWNGYPAGNLGAYNYKGDYSEPPAWPGWSFRRQWTQAIKRWDKQTDIPVFRRSEKVLRTLGWEMQADFEHLTEAQLSSDQYLSLILQVIEMKAGVQEDAEKRTAFRSVLSDTSRKRDETLAQFAMRRLRDFTRAASFGLELPAELRVSLLREGAGLSEQNQQNLTTLLRGREHDVDHLALLLSRMDARTERITGFVTSEEPVDAPEVYLCENGSEGDNSSGDGSEAEHAESDLAALEDLNLNEDQANYVFAILENKFDRKRRTWKENKNYKAEMKKDRGSFVKGVPGDHPRGAGGGLPGVRDHRPRGAKGQGRGKLSREQMNKISRCRLCNKKGHWAEDCHLSRPSAANAVTTQKTTGFCYLGPPSGPATGSGWSFMAVQNSADRVDPRPGALASSVPEAWNFLTFRSGDAILDIGATQDIIGLPAMEALERTLRSAGLKSVEVPSSANAPTGIGGQATVVRSALVPISPGGVPGVINFLVIQSNVPPLLSVGLLEHLGASFDLVTNQISFDKIGVKLRMGVQASGHRTIPLVQWSGGHFPVPIEVQEQYSLPDDAFDLDSKASSRYIKESSSSRDSVAAQDGSRVFASEFDQSSSPHSLDAAHVSDRESHLLTSFPEDPGCLARTSSVGEQLLGSGTLLMGNHSEKPQPQFDLDPRLNHGSHLRARADKGGDKMESLHEPDLLSHGDLPDDVLPAASGGTRTKEPQERPTVLPGELSAGPRSMSAPDLREPGQPVCLLDGVSGMRSPSLLLLEEGCDIKGEGQGSWASDCKRGIPRRGEDNTDYHDPEHYGKELTRGDGDEPCPPRPLHGDSGDVPRLPADELGHARPGAGTKSDVADDDPRAYHTSERDGPEGSHYGRREHGAGAHGGGRGAHRGCEPWRMVSREPRESQCRPPCGPPGLTWPHWMTLSALSLASTIAPWAHISESGKEVLGRYGGGPGSWMVHYPLEAGTTWDADLYEKLPEHLRVPWVQMYVNTPVPEDKTVVWHEGRDCFEQVISRGPGPPSPDSRGAGSAVCHQEICALSTRLELLEEHRSPHVAVVGVSGEMSPAGPFWLVSAPTLDEWIDGIGDDLPETRVQEDVAKNLSWSLMTHLRHDKRLDRRAMYDFADVIVSTPAFEIARREGLRVPPGHERFTEEFGWDVLRRDHRRRFREFHCRCRPTFLSLGAREPYSESGEESVRAKVEADFIIETIRNQIDANGIFVLKADEASQVWRSRGWETLSSQDKSVRMFSTCENGDFSFRVATNSPWLGIHIERDTRSSSEGQDVSTALYGAGHDGTVEPEDSEEMARRLRQQGDFSQSACLRLLRAPRKKDSLKSRKESLVQSGVLQYEVFGQYTHGGMSGITSRTRRNPQFSQYINEFLTRHGANCPRSSFAITSGARLAYHKDCHNVGLNSVITLGEYSGGQIWVEEEGGPDVRQVSPGKWVSGRLHSPRQRVLSFSPRKLHGPEPWQGERWSIVAYQTRSVKNLDSGGRRELRGFGFDVRGYRDSGGSDGGLFWASLFDSLGLRREPLPSYAQVISAEEGEDEEGDEPAEAADSQPRLTPALRHLQRGAPASEPVVSEAQAALVKKLHNNCGHPPVDRFLRTLKAAGALPHVLKYVRDRFHCQDCESRRGPLPRRKAQCPRLFTFNRAVSIDIFYIRFQQASIPVLNMVCSGTNYHVVQRLEGNSDGTPTSTAAWQGFLTTWVRFLGSPQMIICDGGPEFRGQFERGLEQLGVLQHVTAPECPWQNSKSERHGGWLKERLQREVNSGQCSFASLDEMDEFLAALTAAKNRWFNQGGYTPVQLVFGELPRVPAELLSEDQGGLVPLCDAYHDPAGLDECGAEFRRRVQIRERARQAAMEQCSKEALVRATRTSSSTTPAWRSGQWVYVFRRGRPNEALAPKSRWVGPGLVLLNARGIVWVAMRSRLWRCAPEQLRAAFPTEVLGHQLSSDGSLGELLRQVTSGSQARALDVAREGPPGEQDHLRPVDVEEDGVPLSGPVPSLPGHGEPPQAPQTVRPIPEGLLPVPAQAPVGDHPRPSGGRL